MFKHRKSYVEKFVDFHNMKLKPKEKKRSGTPVPEYTIGKRDRNKLNKFLNEYTTIFRAETKLEYKRQLALLDDSFPNDAPEEHRRNVRVKLDGTLGGYEANHGVKWWESEDFNQFVNDCLMMNQMVVTMISRKGIANYQNTWFCKFREKFKFSYNLIPLVEAEDGFIPIKRNGWTKVSKKEGVFLWHGLYISDLGWAVCQALETMLMQQAEMIEPNFDVRLCDYCHTGVYLPDKKSFRFCSNSCGSASDLESRRTA